MLVMLMDDGTLEKHDFENIALSKDVGGRVIRGHRAYTP
jgi:hypothetical protein